MTQILK